MSSLISPVEEGCGHTGVSPAKDHKDDEENGASVHKRRAGNVQPGEEKASSSEGDPINV